MPCNINVQNSHTGNSKSVGACFSFGNASPLMAHMLNNNCDPDISDQGQIDNTSNT
ncbi:spore germination protein [Priestia megaterium]|uniref:spore germination protein n=1 Tax=Priestia megaterium TaxID=1404 RepID=UPI002E1CE75B|nr:spore germination protein [Priestia megaterium]